MSLSGQILNITDNRAKALAWAYHKCFKRLAKPIQLAKWLPRGPYTGQVRTLLENVRNLEIDLQSGNPAVRRLYRDRYTFGDYSLTCAQLRKLSVNPILHITVGIPGDTENSLFEVLRRAYSLKPVKVRVSLFSAEPGSWFFENRQSYGAVFEGAFPFYIRSHRHASAGAIKSLLQKCKVSADSYNYWNRLTRRQGSEDANDDGYKYRRVRLS